MSARKRDDLTCEERSTQMNYNRRKLLAMFGNTSLLRLILAMKNSTSLG